MLDVVGGLRHFDFHRARSTVAYDAGIGFLTLFLGSIVVLWDLKTDAKTNLVAHEADIVSLRFSQTGRWLYSVDGGLSPSLCLWDWAEGALVQHVYLPEKHRKEPVRNCFLLDADSANLFLCVECEQEGYRVSCWDNTNATLTLMFVTELEPTASCVSAFFLPPNNELFVTAEPFCIKLWNIASTSARLSKRIHLSQDIIGTRYSSLTHSFVLLTRSGTVVFISENVPHAWRIR